MSRGRCALPGAAHVSEVVPQTRSGSQQHGDAHRPACPCREYTIDLEQGSQHLIRYRTIAPLVASGAVQLI